MMNPSPRGLSLDCDHDVIFNYGIIVLKSRTVAISIYVYLERTILSLLDTYSNLSMGS